MTEVQALEQQLRGAKLVVENRDNVRKLVQNHEFKKLILEDFIVNDAARLVAESADPALDPQMRADCLAMAQAAGHLKRWLVVAEVSGNTAENQIPSIEAAIVDARIEEDRDTNGSADEDAD